MQIHNVQNNFVNFTSKIKFIPESPDFENICADQSGHVTYPWTIETLKTGNNLYTTGVIDCFAIILTDGKESVCAHLCVRDKYEAIKDGVNKFDVENIKAVLSKKFNLSRKNLHGIMLGGWSDSSNSPHCDIPDREKEYNELKNLFKELKIPMTYICQRKYLNQNPYAWYRQPRYGLAYREDEDSFYITNELTAAYPYNLHSKPEVEVLPDGIEYTQYNRVLDGYKIDYVETRRKAEPQDYLKTQFEDVKLSKIDCFA